MGNLFSNEDGGRAMIDEHDAEQIYPHHHASTMMNTTTVAENNSTGNVTHGNINNITTAAARPAPLHTPHHPYVRGVNIGGWLIAERFITPYLFALTTCDLEGKFCSYPGQASGPDPSSPNYAPCSDALNDCQPIRTSPSRIGRTTENAVEDRLDYPVSEFDILSTFTDKDIARRYMERHWDTFVAKSDIISLKKAGVTHLRVPFGYWVRDNIRPGEPWASGGWKYFVRLVKWCRDIGGIEIWADLHGAPGSQNGFDNSGHYLREDTCIGWCNSTDNVARTLEVVRDVAHALKDDGLLDVVTGFGLLNEPFPDCYPDVLREYYNAGLKIVREVLGNDIAVFVSDGFHAEKWNDGWWVDPVEYRNTYLDTHPYHVFFEAGRAFSPRQHIEYVCQYNTRDVQSCCYEDAPNDTVVSRGISRIVGEWSAAVDTLPTELETAIMNSIADNGTALGLHRELSRDRKDFLRNFVEAQMVAYEAAIGGTSSGWIFWNFKMEGGAFAEWDFLRGIDEGWIPRIPAPNVSSVDLYGSCYDIIYRTNDSYSLVDEYPDPNKLDWKKWQGWEVDDDFVLNDGEIGHHHRYGLNRRNLVTTISLAVLVALVALRRVWMKRKRREGYSELSSTAVLSKTFFV